MPLLRLNYVNPFALAGVWRLDEPASFFLPLLKIISTEPTKLDSIGHPIRQRQWLAGRYLVKVLTEQLFEPFDGVWSDEHSKPHLHNHSGFISISHTQPYVVAMVDLKKPCGIDVELNRDKLKPLASKFLSTTEIKNAGNKLNNLTIMWGAKEALYKLYGRKKLIFKDNIIISDINFDHDSGSFTGNISIKNENKSHLMGYRRFGEYVLVHSC